VSHTNIAGTLHNINFYTAIVNPKNGKKSLFFIIIKFISEVKITDSINSPPIKTSIDFLLGKKLSSDLRDFSQAASCLSAQTQLFIVI